MSIIRASVTDQRLKITEAPVIASGGQNETSVVFTFCEKWDGLVKTAIFYRDEEEVYYCVLDAENTCVVPWEVCYESGTFYIGVFGEKDTARRTSTTARYKVKRGALTEGLYPSNPTLDVYNQIVDMVKGIQDNSVQTIEQDLSEEEKAMARENIGAASVDEIGSGDAVLFSEQTLTNEQKTQARANVGAASKSVVDTLKQAVEAIQAELDYKPIDITKFTNTAAGTYEMGRVINSLTISWELNKTPVSQTLKGETLGVDVRSKTYTNVSTSQNYYLSVKDERGATDSASSSVMFYNGVYYGVMEDGATINDAAILALTKKLQGSRGITFTANAGSNKRHAYALPTRYGTPVFKDADTNLGADFYKANSQPIQFTNASGYTESYDVWLSTNKELGSLTVAVS
jgi:hypothetical protein